MLEFLKVQRPEQIKKLLNQFQPDHQTWIVSDLKSKQEIQDECIKRYGFYADDSILRISDFWGVLLRRLQPKLRVVTSDFIKTLVQLYVDQHGEKIGLTENDVSTLYSHVQELAPMILHPESDSILKEWLSQQSVEKNWARWYLIARNCIQSIWIENKVIDKNWSAAFLQTLDLNGLNWPYELIVDLGTELTSIEMGLFKMISQKQRVQIYVPQPGWQSRYPYLLKTYSENFGYGKIIDLKDEEPAEQTQDIKFVRLSTQLAEVKFAVAEVRKWVNQGVKDSAIAIICPKIEDYWPVLEAYLREEGLFFQKDSVAAVNSLASVQTFLAHLKSFTAEVNFESLQQKFFQPDQPPQMKFEKFKALFSQIYDQDDLKRDEKIESLFYKKINFQAELGRDDFFSILIKIWADIGQTTSQMTDLFEVIFKDLLAQSLDKSMKFKLWYQFLKSRLSRKEIKISLGDPQGLQIQSLNAVHMLQATHRIYMGLFDEAFRNSQKSMLPLHDIETLKNQFDLALDYPEESHLDFNLRWQASMICEKQIMTTPHLSFAAEPLTACLYFLENSPQSEVQTPALTRSDELQKFFSATQGQNLLEYEKDLSKKRLSEDLHEAFINVKSNNFNELSVTDVENYARCGFKLLASKGFRLRDLPEVSIDLDPRQKGTLVHALFEFLVKMIQSEKFDLEKVQFFLDEKRKLFELYKDEEIFWTIQKNKLLKLAEKFNEFEKDRLKFFKAQAEIPFEIYFDLDSKSFSKKKTERSFLIKGRIDRIDQNIQSRYYLIYDYKSSGGQISPYSKWLSDYQFQLLMYVLAAEICVFDQDDRPVQGALYYLYRDFDLSKGFVDKKIGVEDLGLSAKCRSLIEENEKDQLKKSFIDFMTEVFLRLEQGDFQAKPYDIEICDSCDWRKLCRAPHLM